MKALATHPFVARRSLVGPQILHRLAAVLAVAGMRLLNASLWLESHGQCSCPTCGGKALSATRPCASCHSNP